MSDDENITGYAGKGIKIPRGLGTGEAALAYIKAFGTEQTLSSARAAARHMEAANSLKDALNRYERNTNPPDLLIREAPAFKAMQEDAKRAREHRKEELELLRRAANAAEKAIAEAARRELQATKEVRRAYAIAVVGAIVGLAGLVLTAWPFIKERLEAM